MMCTGYALFGKLLNTEEKQRLVGPKVFLAQYLLFNSSRKQRLGEK